MLSVPSNDSIPVFDINASGLAMEAPACSSHQIPSTNCGVITMGSAEAVEAPDRGSRHLPVMHTSSQDDALVAKLAPYSSASFNKLEVLCLISPHNLAITMPAFVCCMCHKANPSCH